MYIRFDFVFFQVLLDTGILESSTFKVHNYISWNVNMHVFGSHTQLLQKNVEQVEKNISDPLLTIQNKRVSFFTAHKHVCTHVQPENKPLMNF